MARAARRARQPGAQRLDRVAGAPRDHAAQAGCPARAILQPWRRPRDPDRTLALKPLVVEAICAVFDPEIPVNVYELGLIYDIVIDAGAVVHVTMTLTSPMCPSAQQLPAEVQARDPGGARRPRTCTSRSSGSRRGART